MGLAQRLSKVSGFQRTVMICQRLFTVGKVGKEDEWRRCVHLFAFLADHGSVSVDGERVGRVLDEEGGEGSVPGFFPQSLTFTIDLGRVYLNKMCRDMVQVR